MENKKYMNFDDALFEYFKYLKFKNKLNSYRSTYSRIINHILPYFKNKNIYDITNLDYLNWQMNIDKKSLSYVYKKGLHICFSAFLNYCKIFYGLKENVASNVGNFKAKEYENNLGEIWDISEFNQFIKFVDDKIYNTFFELLFFSGLRLGEAMALTFNDINFENKQIYINKTATRFFSAGKRVFNTPKSKSSLRNITLDDKLIENIKKLKEYYKNKYLDFDNDFYIFGGDRVLSPTTIERKKNYYCSIAGVKQIKIHEFRHSHACLLFQNNVPIDEISYRLGHSTITMTMEIYLKYLPKNEKRVLETLNSINKI